MSINASWGELLVGAYHKRLNGCEVVSYNNRSEEAGNQMEADVIAIDNDRDTGEQNVYVCEVVTHMSGDLYSGSPDDGWWTEYTNTKAYQYSLQKLEQKFREDYRYVNDTFGNADKHSYQFWAPVVSGWQNGSDIIRGLEALTERFEDETGEELELIINQDYTARIQELREEADGDISNHGAPAFRFLQILENLK
ncbi:MULTISPECIES: hypothetical protein [Haloferax]|uniref:Uncharacterized protein n=1 Tax=Haloferax marinum TaxID=2666143 RepID=A0A6A8G9D8_9EURY|nr:MULTISPECIES: hypothetical protein [Haloferax]KAB1198119.1 hypothetical protein Hfx1150_11540 [Haloferax sp. CBA1150]MRW97192.1 hypothetical protein [Haloferax marinum]